MAVALVTASDHGTRNAICHQLKERSDRVNAP
jgi:hypothetical protein